MHDRSSNSPSDPNQLAKLIVDVATGKREDPVLMPDGRNAAAVALGRRGGLKGGLARAQVLSASQRSEIAKNAAQSRWKAKVRDE